MADFDSPWKEALDFYGASCLGLLFPRVHANIDWQRGCESLDKEFQKIVHDAEQGRRYVDKLFKVWTKDGVETWLLLHIEVQTSRDPEFAKRMYVYSCRIEDRYNREVVSLAILADDDPDWRPSSYEWERWDCRKRTPILVPIIGKPALERRDTNRKGEKVAIHVDTGAAGI